MAEIDPKLDRRTFAKRLGFGLTAALFPTMSHPQALQLPAYLQGYDEAFAENPRAAALKWFQDAKFGLFVHYALASLLPRGKVDFLELLAAEKESAVVKRLFNQFTAENFDADFIADLAMSAGMAYVNLTTQHLGRMYMYRTKVSDFTSLHSPSRRDLLSEMAKACEKRKLGLFLYVPPETARTDDEYIEHNHTILRELLTQYGPIAGIWFDGIGNYRRHPERYTRLSETYALVRSLQPQCLISFKDGGIGEEDFISPEHFLLPIPTVWKNPLRQKRWQIRLQRWKKWNGDRKRWERSFKHKPAEINTTLQECMNRDGVGAPGGWINDAQARHLNADEVMVLLKKARELNANLLLNIGPLGDGSIHPEDMKTLREIGRRIRQNGFPK
ncbi:alpha-L-fucosidase [Acidobacteria bacterium AH-259-O06]|nr:alpha-L-fucosidase [Acidobacteria bacterium AH-259-O06]